MRMDDGGCITKLIFAMAPEDVTAVLSQMDEGNMKENALYNIVANVVPNFKEANEKKDYYAPFCRLQSPSTIVSKPIL